MKNAELSKIALQTRLYRARHKLTQREFGMIFGVSQKVISFLETEAFRELSEKRIAEIKEYITRKSGKNGKKMTGV